MAAAAREPYSDHITRFITRAQLTQSQTAEILLPYLNARYHVDNLRILSVAITIIGLIGAATTREHYFGYGILGGGVAFCISVIGKSIIQERATSYITSALQAKR